MSDGKNVDLLKEEKENSDIVVNAARANMWNLLDPLRNPIWENGNNQPTKIRMTLYGYDFTRTNSSWARSNHPSTTKILPESEESEESINIEFQWWHRSNPQKFGEISLESIPHLLPHLEGNGLPQRPFRSRSRLFSDCINDSKSNKSKKSKKSKGPKGPKDLVSVRSAWEDILEGYDPLEFIRKGACTTILKRAELLNTVNKFPFCAVFGGGYCPDKLDKKTQKTKKIEPTNESVRGKADDVRGSGIGIEL